MMIERKGYVPELSDLLLWYASLGRQIRDICANERHAPLTFLQAAHCRIETKASVRGKSVFVKGVSASAPANVRLIQKMNMAKLMEMLRDSVRKPSL